MNYLPEQMVIHTIITMNNAIAQAHDPPQVGDQHHQIGLFDFRLIQGFADNLELPLDSRAQH